MSIDGVRTVAPRLLDLEQVRPQWSSSTFLRGPSTEPTSNDRPVLEVEVNSFIPMDQVTTPFYVPGGGTFSGDGRGIGEDGTQRTQQTLLVYEDPRQPSGYRVVIEADIGETHRLNGEGEVIETGEAPESDLQGEVVEVRDDGTIVVQLSGQSSNPLIGVAPGITYDLTVEMRPNPDGTWAVALTGEHDPFPGYEVLASVRGGPQQVTYGYDPRVSGASPFDLAEGDGGLVEFVLDGGSPVDVEDSLTVGAELPTPGILIERHTTDGVIDPVALGADLADNAEAGSVDLAFVEQVFARLPEDQRAAVANAFFDNLSLTPPPDWHQAGGVMNYASLALTPDGMNVILAVGQYASERLVSNEILYGFASQNREAIYAGDPAASSIASSYLVALANHPEVQQALADFLDPVYDDDEAGMNSTPEGRALLDQIRRILD